MSEKFGGPLIKTNRGNKLYAKTQKQEDLVDTIVNNQITICHGPAGTGKTFVTTVMAVGALLEGIVDKIVITRPAVQAGEDLGFLPGDIDAKLNPYLKPIYDILELIYPKPSKEHTFHSSGKKKTKIPKTESKQTSTELPDWSDKIEIVPFAFMRGRTFHNSFIIADECQNATKEQLRMIMTRIGMNSKMVIDGDVKQTDIHNNGLKFLIKKLEQKPINDISIIEFSKSDIVRNKIINDIEGLFESDHYKDNPEIISNH